MLMLYWICNLRSVKKISTTQESKGYEKNYMKELGKWLWGIVTSGYERGGHNWGGTTIYTWNQK